MKRIDKLFDMAGYDGCKHIILSAALTVVAKCLLPLWVAILIVLAIGVAKEVYDKVSGNGCAENKDMVCDIIGIIIGVL